jgi:hypothetical protein
MEQFTCGICGAEVREDRFVFEEGSCQHCADDKRKAERAEWNLRLEDQADE